MKSSLNVFIREIFLKIFDILSNNFEMEYLVL